MRSATEPKGPLAGWSPHPPRLTACRGPAFAIQCVRARLSEVGKTWARHGQDMGELTVLLQRAQGGDAQARQQLFAVAYGDLRRQARARLRDGGRNTLLDTTALVHESFIRFVQAGALDTNCRGQFFSYAANVMRSVIVDHARQRQSARRGGDLQQVTFDTQAGQGSTREADQIVEVHEAVDRLALADPRLAQVVEMRYFAGMEESEIAAALGVTARTVRRDWKRARLLLSAALA
jgi:RNA polymerase sigma factor (TIGR02999 family)